MKKFIISIICIAFLVTFLLTIKNTNKNTNTDKELTKVKVAEVTHSLFYTPMYVAHALGYFEDNGLNVEIILTSGVNKICIQHTKIIPYINKNFYFVKSIILQ